MPNWKITGTMNRVSHVEMTVEADTEAEAREIAQIELDGHDGSDSDEVHTLQVEDVQIDEVECLD